MSHLKIEQAIFTSADNATMKGYQLVARSAGVDRDTRTTVVPLVALARFNLRG